MKGNSLFKKIGAIATTAAMLASLGVTGFAANSPSSSNANTGVSVGTPTVTPVEGKAGLYEVSVGYTVTDNTTHKIGVTMLAYGMTDGTSLDRSDISTGYDPGDDEENPTMKIVGVDQKNASEDTDDTFTAGETGTFTFYVSTTAETYGSQIQMNPGQTGIVLLSGDGAVGANGAFFSIPAPAGVVSSVGSITNIDYPSYVSDTEKLERIKAGALAALGTTGVVVTVGEKAVDPDTEDTIAVTADFAGTHDTEVKKTTEGGYKLVITLKSDVTTDGGTYTLKSGTKIEISLTSVTAKALFATDVSIKGYTDGAVLGTVSVSEDDTLDDIKAAMADKIEAKGLVFADEDDHTVEVSTSTDSSLAVTVKIEEEPGTDSETVGNIKLGNYKVSYTVTVPEKVYTGAKGATVEFTDDPALTVTETSVIIAVANQATTVEADTAVLNGVTDNTITTAVKPTEEAIQAAVRELTATISLSTDSSITGESINLNAATVSNFVRGTGANQNKVTFDIAIPSTSTELTSLTIPESGLTIEDVTIEVWLLGDINGDTAIDSTDWSIITAHDNGGTQITDVAELWRANVDRDEAGAVDSTDWSIITAHDNGGTQIVQPEID